MKFKKGDEVQVDVLSSIANGLRGIVARIDGPLVYIGDVSWHESRLKLVCPKPKTVGVKAWVEMLYIGAGRNKTLLLKNISRVRCGSGLIPCRIVIDKKYFKERK